MLQIYTHTHTWNAKYRDRISNISWCDATQMSYMAMNLNFDNSNSQQVISKFTNLRGPNFTNDYCSSIRLGSKSFCYEVDFHWSASFLDNYFIIIWIAGNFLFDRIWITMKNCLWNRYLGVYHETFCSYERFETRPGLWNTKYTYSKFYAENDISHTPLNLY